MNSFSIRLGTLDLHNAATGHALEIRSGPTLEGAETVEIVLIRHKPGPKGGTKVEESLGHVHVANLDATLSGVLVLTNGGRRE